MARVFMQRVTWRQVGLVVSEAILITAAVVVCARLRLPAGELPPGVWMKAFLIATVTQLCLYYADLYDFRVHLRSPRAVRPHCSRRSAPTSLILALVYFWLPALIIGRGVFVLAAALVVITVVAGWRLAFEWLTGRRRRRASGCCSSAPARRAVDARARAATSARGARRRDRRLRRSRSGTRRARRCSTPASSARSTTFRRSCERAIVDRSSSAWPDARGKLPMDKLLDMKLERRRRSTTWRRSTRSTPARSRSRTCVRAG